MGPHHLHEKGLEITGFIDPGIPTSLRGDPGRLRQILTNLGGNAVKFTEKGEIIIRASLESGDEQHVCVRFAVSDTGIGIPPEKQTLLFTPFTQVDGSRTRKYGGTGLGLAISKQLAELMGGSIGLVSVEGQGSTFWFTVALEKGPVGPEGRQPLAKLEGARVLIGDDHAVSRLQVSTFLSGWGCRWAEAEEAWPPCACYEKQSRLATRSALLCWTCFCPVWVGSTWHTRSRLIRG